MNRNRNYLLVLIVVCLLGLPLIFFSGMLLSESHILSEFEKLPGVEAQKHLGDAWPPEIDPQAVKSCSHKTESSRDSFSSWYCLEISRAAAKDWMESIHRTQEQNFKEDLFIDHYKPEGVHRQITGPPPEHWQNGTSPQWWRPPATAYRATEIMLWYIGYESGVGRALYSTFDPTTGQLWIYENSAQHDQLWQPGELPEGTVINFLGKH